MRGPLKNRRFSVLRRYYSGLRPAQAGLGGSRHAAGLAFGRAPFGGPRGIHLTPDITTMKYEFTTRHAKLKSSEEALLYVGFAQEAAAIVATRHGAQAGALATALANESARDAMAQALSKAEAGADKSPRKGAAKKSGAGAVPEPLTAGFKPWFGAAAAADADGLLNVAALLIRRDPFEPEDGEEAGPAGLAGPDGSGSGSGPVARGAARSASGERLSDAQLGRDFAALAKTMAQAVEWMKSSRRKTARLTFGAMSQALADRLMGLWMAVADEATYSFDLYKSEPKAAAPELIGFEFDPDADARGGLSQAFERVMALSEAESFVRKTGDMPANKLTPERFADMAKQYAQKKPCKFKALNELDCERLGMGLFLSVAAGSQTPARFVEIAYGGAPDPKDPPIVLVGKGVTFDSGGVSLKPPAAMDEMKFDMLGAASMVAATGLAARLKLPLNILCLAPLCENMPSGSANKPGDVARGMGGLSVEIVNTDAEGRLLLADALSYAAKRNPALIVDAATLTGACVVALGSAFSGLYSNDEGLAQRLQTAGERALDRVWRMPLDEEYASLIESPVADLSNSGGRPAGSCTAALFLERFAEGCKWAHIDVAGTAWKGGKKKAPTGRPLRLIARFLLDLADERAAEDPGAEDSALGRKGGPDLIGRLMLDACDESVTRGLSGSIARAKIESGDADNGEIGMEPLDLPAPAAPAASAASAALSDPAAGAIAIGADGGGKHSESERKGLGSGKGKSPSKSPARGVRADKKTQGRGNAGKDDESDKRDKRDKSGKSHKNERGGDGGRDKGAKDR